jgi:hypothetical protein
MITVPVLLRVMLFYGPNKCFTQITKTFLLFDKGLASLIAWMSQGEAILPILASYTSPVI